MTKVFFLSFFYLFFSINEAPGQHSWKWFSPKGQPFEVIAPYEMKSGEKKLLTDVGEMHPITWICEGKTDDPNYLFMLSYVDYPAGVLTADSTALLKEMLDESMKAHIENLKGELVYQGELDYGHNPGIIYRASYNDNNIVVKCRMIIIGDRFYSLQVYCNTIWSMNIEMDRFLMSFRLK